MSVSDQYKGDDQGKLDISGSLSKRKSLRRSQVDCSQWAKRTRQSQSGRCSNNGPFSWTCLKGDRRSSSSAGRMQLISDLGLPHLWFMLKV